MNSKHDNPMPVAGRRVVAVLSVLALGGPALAQWGGGPFGGGAGMGGEAARGVPTLLTESLDQMMLRSSRAALNNPFANASQQIQSLYPPGWQALDPRLIAFQGFPSLAPEGLGAFPFPGGQLPIPFGEDSQLPPAVKLDLPKSPHAWPSWFPEESAEEAEGFRSDVGIIAQASDYVWVRETELRAFVPLAYWDRFRVLTAGAAVDVRGDGQYLMVFHDGGRFRVSGNARMVIGDLVPEAIEIGFDEVSRVYGLAADRPFRVRLGHAGTVEALATTWRIAPDGGFLSVENRGPGTMRLESPDAEVSVPPGHRIRVFLAGSPDVHVDAELEVRGGLEARSEGRVLQIDGGVEGGVVAWSGARLRVPSGATLRIDPLSGAQFPENRAGADPR